MDTVELTDQECHSLQELALGSDLVVWLSEKIIGKLEDLLRSLGYPFEKVSWRVERVEGGSSNGHGSFLNCVGVAIACIKGTKRVSEGFRAKEGTKRERRTGDEKSDDQSLRDVKRRSEGAFCFT